MDESIRIADLSGSLETLIIPKGVDAQEFVIQWAKAMERRVKELEKGITGRDERISVMGQVIEEQEPRIKEMRRKIMAMTRDSREQSLTLINARGTIADKNRKIEELGKVLEMTRTQLTALQSRVDDAGKMSAEIRTGDISEKTTKVFASIANKVRDSVEPDVPCKCVKSPEGELLDYDCPTHGPKKLEG